MDRERQRRPRGAGTIFRKGKYWAAQVSLRSAAKGQRNRRSVSGTTFCRVLKELSALAPPQPHAPLNGRTSRRTDALKLAKERGTHTAQEWYALCRQADNRCAYCREYGRMGKDHVIPITRGGSDSIDNIVPACRSCNSAKNQLTADEYRHLRTIMGLPYGSPEAEAMAWFDEQPHLVARNG